MQLLPVGINFDQQEFSLSAIKTLYKLGYSLKDLECLYFQNLYEELGSEEQIAKFLKIHITTVQSKLKKYGMRK